MEIMSLPAASNTPGKAAAFGERNGIDHVSDGYDPLLAMPEVDAVYVANTQNFHFDSVIQSLEAGKHVLCEKPLAVNAQQVEAMIQKAKEKNLFLMEAIWTRFLPPCTKIKKMAR